MNLQILNTRPRKDGLSPQLENDIRKVNKDGKLYFFSANQSKDETKYHLSDNNLADSSLFGLGDLGNNYKQNTTVTSKFKPDPDFIFNEKDKKVLQKSNSNISNNNNNKSTITHNKDISQSISKSSMPFKENENNNHNINNNNVSMQIFDEYMDELDKKKKREWIHTNVSTDPPVKTAINIIQSKYEKNLQVISSLHDEKTMMQRRMSELQYENSMLRKQAGLDDYSDYDNYNDNDNIYDYNGRDRIIDEYDDDYNYNTNKKMTAMELALCLESDDNHDQDHHRESKSRPKSAPVSSSISKSSSSSRLGMSKTLLAAQDKFIQRRRASDIAERKKQIQDEKSDREYREKVHHASLRGKAPTGIFERQKAANDKFLSKQQKRDLAEKAIKEADEKLKREQIEADDEFRNDPKNHFTWHEMCDIEEAKRKDRIEKRKHELASFSRAPKCAIIDKKATESKDEKKYEFIAEDPDLVGIRLQRERAEWEEKIKKARKKAIKKLEAERVNTINPVTGLNKFTSGMESRQEEYIRRKNEKKEKNRIEKDIEIERKRREDEMRTYKLRESLPPPTKITKAVEILVNETRKKLSDQDKKTKENFNKSISRNSYLSDVQEALELKAKDAAAAFIEQSRRNMTKNKKNINLAVKNRPTLIQRQEAKVRQEEAVDNAIAKINCIIKDTMLDKAEEKISSKANNYKKYNDNKYDSDDDYEDKGCK